MRAMTPPRLSLSTAGELFSNYDAGVGYDEMFDPSGARPQYGPLFDELRASSAGELGMRQVEADKAFLTQGITFTVYGDEEGTERIFPFDLLPRIITAAEWRTLVGGLTQRLTAINLFLKDVYHEGRILAEGIVPRDLLYSCRHFRREMRGVRVHRDIYVSVAGSDLVRLEDGRFVVLEDNLRVPSGVSYMLANREVTKRVMPGLFDRYQVSPIAQYRPGAPRHAARSRAAARRGPDLRCPDSGRRQLRLLRARVPGARNGRGSCRGPRPPRPRQHRLHADDRRPPPRRRDLSSS